MDLFELFSVPPPGARKSISDVQAVACGSADSSVGSTEKAAVPLDQVADQCISVFEVDFSAFHCWRCRAHTSNGDRFYSESYRISSGLPPSPLHTSDSEETWTDKLEWHVRKAMAQLSALRLFPPAIAEQPVVCGNICSFLTEQPVVCGNTCSSCSSIRSFC